MTPMFQPNQCIVCKVPVGRGRLCLTKIHGEYALLIGVADRAVDLDLQDVPEDEKIQNLFAIVFQDPRSVDSYIAVLTEIAKLMRKQTEQTKETNGE